MRFVDGVDLRTKLRDSGALGEDEALVLLDDVAAGLDAAHEVGLVHRDVKPANILLSGGSKPTAYLTDFGLTKGMQGGSAQLTGTGQWIGTVDYVAPEQMTTGMVDARTDVYALGCVLFEVISGSPPFSGSDMQRMWHQVNEPLPSLSEHRGAHPLDPVIARATAKEKDGRFPSAGDLARAARAAVDGTADELDEHSVATGAAAAGMASVGGGAPTRTMRGAAPRARSEAATTRLQAPAPPPPRPRSPGGGGTATRLAGVIGACVIAAAGLIAAAMVLAGGDDAPTSRTVIEKPAPTVAAKTPERDVASASGAGEGETPDTTALSEGAGCCRAESGADPELFETYSQTLYDVDIPNGWELDDDDIFNGTFYESTWHPPGDPETTILIDAQTPVPALSPITSAEEVRSETSQSDGYRELSFEPTLLAGSEAARWVFEFPGDRRVDYFVNGCSAGIAVLGSTSPIAFGSLASLFHEVASSVRTDC
jgi:hypothetical protein